MHTWAWAWKLLVDLVQAVGRDRVVDRAATVAYFMLFAAIPFLLAVLELLGWLGWTGVVQAFGLLVQDAFPPALAGVLSDEMARLGALRSSGRLALALGAALYSGQRAVGALLMGIARAWRVPRTRGALVLRAVGALGTLVVLSTSLAAAFLLTAGTWLFVGLHQRGWISADTLSTLALLRVPLVLLLVHTIIHTLYRLAVPRVHRRLWSPGSVLATAGWVLLGLGFQVYISRVTDLGATYGSLGAAVGMLLYGHALAVAVLLGAELDARLTLGRPSRGAPPLPPPEGPPG